MAGVAFGQERLPARQTACGVFRDAKTDETPITMGSWDCPKLTKRTKKTACRARCNPGMIIGFKKATMKVKCGETPSGGTIKKKPSDATLACHTNLCDLSVENALVNDGSLILTKSKKTAGAQLGVYELRCRGENRPRKGVMMCSSADGVFMSKSLPNWRTVCERRPTTEKFICDFDAGSGDLEGKIVIQAGSKGGVNFMGTLMSTNLVDFDQTEHGIHVHQVGAPLDGDSTCSGTGGHFSIAPQIHGRNTAKLPNRHAGDLGNFLVARGDDTTNMGTVDMTDKVVSLNPSSALFIGDKSLVVHADPDDFNPSRDPASTGNAGGRPGCCSIKPIRYSCDFASGPGSGTPTGIMDLRYDNGKVVVSGTIGNLADGMHGFHVHQTGLLTNACADSGGHFESTDGEDETHGASTNKLPNRHAGDLGNIMTTSGVTEVSIEDMIVSLIDGDATFIGGRALVIHADMDDGNPGGLPDSENGAGNAGSRVGCCVITAV